MVSVAKCLGLSEVLLFSGQVLVSGEVERPFRKVLLVVEPRLDFFQTKPCVPLLIEGRDLSRCCMGCFRIGTLCWRWRSFGMFLLVIEDLASLQVCAIVLLLQKMAFHCRFSFAQNYRLVPHFVHFYRIYILI